MINKLLIISISLLLVACDFTVSLSDKPEMMIDNRAVGLWERTKHDGHKERLLILPLNDREYFVSWPEGANTELYARAHLFDFSGRTLVQLQWFGNSDGGVPDDNQLYQIAAYAITDNGLEIRMLNADVTGKDFQTAGELAKAIKANADNPSLFREKMSYIKTGE